MSLHGSVGRAIGQISIYLAKQPACQLSVIQMMFSMFGEKYNLQVYKDTMFTLYRNRYTCLKVFSILILYCFCYINYPFLVRD